MLNHITVVLRKLCLLLAIPALISGSVLLGVSLTVPVYHEGKSPEELSAEIGEMDISREAKFKMWRERLTEIETNHKRLADFGRGLMAAGFGILVALVYANLYLRHRKMRRLGSVLAFWAGLWLIAVLSIPWYYMLRFDRFDYPVWGDSIAIPVFAESIAKLVAAVVSMLVLSVLSINHPFKKRLTWRKPVTPFGWFRVIVLSLWLAFNALVLPYSVPDGDEGMTFTCTCGSAVLLVFLLTKEKRR